MKCLNCDHDVAKLDNEHLIACSGLTLQEYAIRHCLPLELLVSTDQLNQRPQAADFISIATTPGEAARAVLEGLRLSGLLGSEGEFAVIPGGIRWLDLLLWDLNFLNEYGFRFCQDYEFDESTNRVVARNKLRSLRRNLLGRPRDAMTPVPPPDFATALAVCIGHCGEMQAGYLFIALTRRVDADEAVVWLEREHGVAMHCLSGDDEEPVLLRTRTTADSGRLLAALEPQLRPMPGVWDRFHASTPELTVAKELSFDSAHFITDHPAKCSNQHGGRYVLRVKVRGRIDPITGCVVDFGYLKKVVTREIVELFDHHHLNYVAGELAWRSTTEVMCVFIWQRLIEYLPALAELELYETPQSSCRYTGPSLAEFQASGGNSVLTWFQQETLGRSPWRSLLRPEAGESMRTVGRVRSARL
ncbi:MAG: 6-carboxytetrahydropterin synthase [Betaproteobacteria bacterium]|nr:6-carboxytetrahydropterin synthase [Betaproteobacteria bacterium]